MKTKNSQLNQSLKPVAVSLFIALLCLAQLVYSAEESVMKLEQSKKSSKPEVLQLWDGVAGKGKTTSELHVYRVKNNPAPAFLVCPGGGYSRVVMEGEGDWVAKWLNSKGISAFVLKYELPNGRPLVPIGDAQRAMRLIRSRATEWGVDPKKVGVMGFSAGGHLAATLGTHFDEGNGAATDSLEKESCRPDFMVLIYPVISMGEKTHPGSRKSLLGMQPTKDLVDNFSNEKQVTEKTPPTFLAHAVDDKLVSPDNSKMFYEALRAKSVPAEYLELPSGGHGLGHYKGPMWEKWQEAALQWLTANFIKKEAIE